ncbi:glycoside hydrolase family 2 TIM barrel-domain containing protein [Sphingobium boeckii]|uniref:Beta-galactosidase n=1 Tax=Sphingobium boeckii TaxID=1082345 RepID=A0A7W9AHV0_9SPHN|nr:glycoside hydrolase family 2 TIM barrel-domain containing protein [Sphingobium boeckii]MBB5685975.1 beta-galactosidase [Sphingobium boeckii]
MTISGTRFETDRRTAMTLATGAVMLPLIPSSSLHAAVPSPAPLGLGRQQPFDSDWRFLRSAGEGFEAPDLDDKAWRSVDLPHDWSIEDVPGEASPRQVGPFTRDSVGGAATGFTVGGEGWYRKHFRLAALPADCRVEIEFDGVYMLSDVWLNGKNLGSHVHGYTPFSFDLTPHLRRDGDNVLAVRVRNLGKNSRWYSGSGIYREVRISILPTPARIAHWGVAAWTRRIADGQASIDVTTQTDNATADLMLTTRLRTDKGRIVAESTSPASGAVEQELTVKSPTLWSPDKPHLYTLESELKRGKTVVDRVSQPFGIRIVTMDAANGMKINDTPIKLRGACIHHDNGLLGAMAFSDADERRVRLLKARGFNAVRSSHNPASASFRSACDRLGMFLIEEAFDMWHVAKLKDDYSNYIAQDWENALAAMVKSARNSPSVIMWSIGNEVPDRSSPEGLEWCWKFSNAIKTMDPTRPITAGLNGVLGAPVIASEKTARPGFAGKTDDASTIFLDVPGYNYRLTDIEAEQKVHPERVIYASETFPVDAYDYQALLERAPYFMGEFVWTAMDYLGEAGCGATARVKANVPFYLAQYPWMNAWCGDIDLIGQQKPQSLVRDVIWGLSPVALLVQRPIPEGMKEFIAPWGWRDELPSWTWPDAAGKPMAVRIYSLGDKVELRLNGASMGTKSLTPQDKAIAEFQIAYASGTLEAIAYRNGKEIGRQRLETVSAPARLHVTAEKPARRADRQGLSYVAIEVHDAQGRIIPEAELPVQLVVNGPAALIGFGSASPFAVGSFQSDSAKTFRGRALAIVRGTGGKGSVRLEARTEGLAGGAATLRLG